MQQELRSSYPALRIELLGVNEKGQEPGNVSATAGRTIPWLQDVDANVDGKSDVFTSWQVALRDVVILDGTNAKVGVYNLNSHDLANSNNFATLRELLVDAAMASQLPWQNAVNRLDVDNSNTITPLDVLIIINRLNGTGAGDLPPPVTAELVPPFYDTSGENQVTALDALQVINYLNARPVNAGGEGEDVSSASVGAAHAGDGREAALDLSISSSAGRNEPATVPAPTVVEALVPIDDGPDDAWRSGVDLALGPGRFSKSSMMPATAAFRAAADPDEWDDWWLSPAEMFGAADELAIPV